MDRPALGFIGIGVVGTALATALAGAGYSIVAVYSRRRARAAELASSLSRTQITAECLVASTPQQVVDASDLIFLTVSDDAIRPMCDSLTWTARKAAVHCNGSASTELLARAAAGSAAAGVFHPLQSFATPEQAAANLPGSPFGIEASTADLLAVLQRMAEALGGTALVVRGDKAIYHASAVIASNFLVTVVDIAAGLWDTLGLSKEEGLRALLPLVRGTVENLDHVGLPAALTGPIARGDVGPIRRHIAALTEVAPQLVPVYKELARRTIPIALAKGRIDKAAAEAIAAALTDDGPNHGGAV
jgi:predicted short-subunit dehydrogenase-like oxidoreductase (DUF2520 family)